jgi:hypothetical protein
VTFLFPFCFPRDFEVIQDGWTAFSVESEFSRLQAISDEWRISDVNANFAVFISFCLICWSEFFLFRSVKAIPND